MKKITCKNKTMVKKSKRLGLTIAQRESRKYIHNISITEHGVCIYRFNYSGNSCMSVGIYNRITECSIGRLVKIVQSKDDSNIEIDNHIFYRPNQEDSTVHIVYEIWYKKNWDMENRTV